MVDRSMMLAYSSRNTGWDLARQPSAAKVLGNGGSYRGDLSPVSFSAYTTLTLFARRYIFAALYIKRALDTTDENYILCRFGLETRDEHHLTFMN